MRYNIRAEITSVINKDISSTNLDHTYIAAKEVINNLNLGDYFNFDCCNKELISVDIHEIGINYYVLKLKFNIDGAFEVEKFRDIEYELRQKYRGDREGYNCKIIKVILI